MKYQVVAEGGGETEIEADSIEGIEELAAEWMQDGDWGTPRSYARVYITELDAAGDETDEHWSIEVIVGDDVDEPDCVEGQEHDWQSPEWLGGCKENPGVWGIGGTQIASQTVCVHCGAYRHYVSESTPGNNPRTPDITTYEVSDERSEEWVKEMSEEE